MALATNEAYLAIALGIDVWVFEKSSGKTVLMYSNEKDPETRSPSEPFVSSLSFSSSSLYLGDYGKRVQRFSVPDFEHKEAMSSDKKITHVETYKNNIIAANKAGAIEFFTLEENKMNRLKYPCGHLMSVLDVKLVDWTPPDDPADESALMISCGAEKKIWINRYQKTYIIESFAFGHEAFVCKLAIAEPDMFISGSGDGSVRVWDLKGREKFQVQVAKPENIGKFAIVGLTLLAHVENKEEKDEKPARTLFVSTNHKQQGENDLLKIERYSLDQTTGKLTKTGGVELNEAGEILATIADSFSGIWVLVAKKPHLRYVDRDGKVVEDIAHLATINEAISKKEVDTSKLPRFWQDFDRLRTKRVDVTERKRQVKTKRARSKKTMSKYAARKKRKQQEQRDQWEEGTGKKG